jgi:hypothetical protein
MERSGFTGLIPMPAICRFRPWLRPAIAAALGGLDAADTGTMSWGLLHADPAPDAFRLDPVTGRCGVIDWSYFLYGPSRIALEHQGDAMEPGPVAAAACPDRLSHPWKCERSPASQASRSPGLLRSQSGRISLVTTRRSRQRS